MKTHQLTLATLLLIFFLTSNSEAQTIDSLAIVPTNPTTTDTVKIISYTFHPYSDCPLTSSSININNDTITVYVSHTLGIMPTTCYSIDTLTIGILNEGTYELTYHLFDTVPPNTYDLIDTISFTIQQSSGLQPTDYSDLRLRIYPNPFKTTTTIFIDDKLLTSPLKIRIYDIFGREIRRINKIRNNEINITRDDLTGGLYFIKVIRDDKIIDSRKIIIE